MINSDKKITQSTTYHREHVTSYLLSGKTQQVDIGLSKERPHWRWTVDSKVDLIMMQEAFSLFGNKWKDIDYEELVDIFDSNPDLARINSMERQKAIEEI